MDNGDRVALIIASYQYDDRSLRQLIAPAEDAESLAEVLRDPEIGGFTVRTLINEPHDVVRREIVTFFENRRLDDLILLYYSGHGIKDQDGRLYLATVDTDHKLPMATAVEDSLIQGMMHRSRSRKQVLILDCCYSGAFGQGMVPRGDERIGSVDHFKGRGRVVLTASDAMQYAFEGDTFSGEGIRSVFTSSLVEGLKTGEADMDRDGFIAIDELYDYVHDQVHLKTPNQIPEISTYGAQGNLQIARNPVPIVTRADLPAPLQAAIESPDSLARYGAATELEHLLDDSDAGLVLAALAELEKLTEDDSRRVSRKAQEAIATYRLRHPESVMAGEQKEVLAGKASDAAAGSKFRPARREEAAPFSLTIDPPSATGETSATYTITIRNDGDKPERYLFSHKTGNRRIRYEFDQDQIIILPRGSAAVTLTVHANPRGSGGSKNLRFSVRAKPESVNAVRSVDGTFVQYGTGRNWLKYAVVTASMLLLLCAGVFIGTRYIDTSNSGGAGFLSTTTPTTDPIFFGPTPTEVQGPTEPIPSATGSSGVDDLILAPPLPALVPLNGYSMGDPNAPVLVTQFSDYQCAGCGNFTREVLPLLVQDYIASGQVLFQYFDWPTLGQESVDAAHAAACANEQGNFWPYHDMLYYNQDSNSGDVYSRGWFEAIAETVGLDLASFNTCMDAGYYYSAVEEHRQIGTAYGVTSTPSILVDGVVVPGAQDYTTLQNYIQQAILY